MGSLILGLGFFALFLITHIVWFRIQFPKRQLVALLGVMIFWLLVYVVLLVLMPDIYRFGVEAPDSPFAVPLTLTSMVLYVLACLAYIIVYSGTEVESPSLKIIMLINEHPEGMSHAELRSIFNNERVVLSRVNDLVKSDLANFDGTYYMLQPRGQRLARIFETYRKLLGRGIGG